MFIYIFSGWHNPEILPYGNLSLSPACSALHYGIECFEGMKAYKDDNGGIRWIYVYTYMYMYVCLYMCVHKRVCIYMRICMYVCMYGIECFEGMTAYKDDNGGIR
jgi:branched-subunit amino acid aminotransferase/4-amino-4-deoxychorismate lyase